MHMTRIKETSTNFANKKALAEECAEVYTASILGGQWTLVICSCLLNGKLRFSELKNLLPNATDRTLALSLRKLEEANVIKRSVYAQVPVKVEYELTQIGYQLEPVIRQLEIWAAKHKAQGSSSGKQ
jgi:DNA-binding HxlR family transcriptional regulator